MKNKTKPITGFYATCKCRLVIGAMDYIRTDPKDASIIVNKWFKKGCSVTPVFDHSWSKHISVCQCDEA